MWIPLILPRWIRGGGGKTPIHQKWKICRFLEPFPNVFHVWFLCLKQILHYSYMQSHILWVSAMCLWCFQTFFPGAGLSNILLNPPRWNYTDVTSLYHLKSFLSCIYIVKTYSSKKNYFKPLHITYYILHICHKTKKTYFKQFVREKRKKKNNWK